MTWNYRIIDTGERLDLPHFTIREVYYEGKKIMGWTGEPCYPSGESIEELKKDLLHMKLAFKKPVLKIKNGKLIK